MWNELNFLWKIEWLFLHVNFLSLNLNELELVAKSFKGIQCCCFIFCNEIKIWKKERKADICLLCYLYAVLVAVLLTINRYEHFNIGLKWCEYCQVKSNTDLIQCYLHIYTNTELMDMAYTRVWGLLLVCY